MMQFTEYANLFLTTDSTDNCGSMPCYNNGTCHDVGLTYTCECAAGFTGPNCLDGKTTYLFIKSTSVKLTQD